MAVRGRLARVLGGNVVPLTEETFDAFVEGRRLAVVDFWAAWCRPCRAMAPVLRSLAREHGPAVAFAKVDTDAEEALAKRYRIRSIPTYIVFRRGEAVDRFSGVITRRRFSQKIDKWR